MDISSENFPLNVLVSNKGNFAVVIYFLFPSLKEEPVIEVYDFLKSLKTSSIKVENFIKGSIKHDSFKGSRSWFKDIKLNMSESQIIIEVSESVKKNSKRNSLQN